MDSFFPPRKSIILSVETCFALATGLTSDFPRWPWRYSSCLKFCYVPKPGRKNEARLHSIQNCLLNWHRTCITSSVPFQMAAYQSIIRVGCMAAKKKKLAIKNVQGLEFQGCCNTYWIGTREPGSPLLGLIMQHIQYKVLLVPLAV